MKPKFKIGELVHFKDYHCVFKIKEIVKISEERIAYRLILVPPTPKSLTWLSLILRVEIAFDTSLVSTPEQKRRNRDYKLNQLLK